MSSRTLLVIIALVLSGPVTGYPADPPVSLELVAEPGFPIDGQQRWMRFLQDRQLGLTNVRIVSARAGDKPKIDNRGSDSAPRYTVTGILTSGGRLILPGLLVRYGQRKELQTWLVNLRRGGDDAVTALKGAFGLTAKQLSTLQNALKRQVVLPTKDKPVREVVQHIQRVANIPLDIDPNAQQALSGDSRVMDDLQGLSCGTALAAAVRPFGLRVAPTGQGTRNVGIRVTRNAKPEDAWPIGMRAKNGAMDIAPALVHPPINVEVVDQPLDDTLNTIQGRLKIPFLYDHNALARHEVDLHDTVNLPRKKTFYKKIIDQLLFQKLLVAELRTDEAGAPFLWITSAKR